MTVKTASNAHAPPIPYREMGEIDYDSLDFDPYESVEKPDAMEQHREQRAMLNLLDAYFSDYGRRPDVFVDFDSNICWDPTDLRRHVSPDVYIVFGVDAAAIRKRLIYLPWEAGKPPDFAMEFASRSTSDEDTDDKPDIYERIGVPEYWMHDATGGRYYGFLLKGLKLVDGEYREIELTREPDGVLKGYSEVLGLSLAWDDGFPRLYDRASGRYLESVMEIADARRAAETQRDAFAAQRDMAEMQLESEVRARAAERAAAQAEISRLRERIRRMENG